MNILYASDDNFAEIAGVSILSLFENNKDADEINVYLIDNYISEQNKSRLNRIQNDYQRKITFLKAPDIESIAGTALDTRKERWSLAIFLRLFISSILPTDMEKILYLDCDTIVRKSLKELWDSDLGQNVMSGQVSRIGTAANAKIMLGSEDIYINSGVLLINLRLWRAFCVEEKYIRFIKLMDGRFSCPDQDVLSSVLKGYIGVIDPTYNCSPPYAIINKAVEYNLKDKIPSHEKSDDPVIIHYIGEDSIVGRYIRPWEEHIDEDNPIAYPDIRDEWLKYKAMSPWRDEPLRQPRRKASSKNTGIARLIKKYKPLYSFLINTKKAAARTLKKTRRQMTPQEYLAYREKITGIKLEDCRISNSTHDA